MALAYLMQEKDWTLKEALEFVTQHRPCANPNAGFMTQLLKLEEKLHGKKTVKVLLIVDHGGCAAQYQQLACAANLVFSAAQSSYRF